MPSIAQTIDDFTAFFGDSKQFREIAVVVHGMLADIFGDDPDWTAYGYLHQLRQTRGDMCRYANVLKSQAFMDEYKREVHGQAVCCLSTLAAAHKRILHLMQVLGEDRFDKVVGYMEGTANPFVLYTLYAGLYEQFAIPLFQEEAAKLKDKAFQYVYRYPGAGRFFPEEFKAVAERISHGTCTVHR